MTNLPPPPPDSGGSPPPPVPGSHPSAHSPGAMTGWATIGTGQQVELASAGARLGARILDVLIIAAIPILLFFSTDLTAAGITLFTSMIGLVYEVTLIATKGQTLGKMAVNIKVARVGDGLVPGWGKSIGRWILPAVLNFIPFIGGLLSLLVYLSLLWGKSRRGWHDMIAGTVVVKV